MIKISHDAPRAGQGIGSGEAGSIRNDYYLSLSGRKGKRERWDLYEIRKRELNSRNLSPAEYQVEISRICRELGI